MKRWRTTFVVYCTDFHYNDVIMGTMASQITSLTNVYSTVYLGADQRKHQSSASLAFVWEIHRGPVNSPHKWQVTRKMFPFDDVIVLNKVIFRSYQVRWHTVALCVTRPGHRESTNLVTVNVIHFEDSLYISNSSRMNEGRWSMQRALGQCRRGSGCIAALP